MPDVIHNSLTNDELHESFHRVSTSDPGAIGAGKYWLDTSSTPHKLKRRNAGNTAWVVVNGGQSKSTLVVAASDAPQDQKDAADYVCDGTADQVEIQAAHDAFTTGGKVVLTIGTFNISSSINIDNDSFTLEGSGNVKPTGATQIGMGTKLKAVSGLTSQVILAGSLSNRPIFGCTLKSFTIDGGYIGTATNGITYRSNQGLIFDVHVHDCTGWGIKVIGYSAAETGGSKWDTYDTKILSCMVGDCYDTGNKATATAGGGVWFADFAPDCHIMNCILLNNYDNIRITSASEQITSNHFYDAVHWNMWFDSSGSRTKVVGNKIEGSGSHGIMIDNTTAGTSALQFVGNNIKNSGDDADNSADHMNITGSSSFGHTAMVIVGNSFTKDSATANKPRNGINMSSANQGTLIVGNSFGADTHFGSTRIVDSSSGSNPALIGFNSGYRTRNGGQTSVSDGGTITHNIGDSFAGRAPTKVNVTSMTAGVIATVSAISATTITVNLRSHDGTTPGATTVLWSAEI